MMMNKLKILCFICTVFTPLPTTSVETTSGDTKSEDIITITSNAIQENCAKYDTTKKCKENEVEFYLKTKNVDDVQELNADDPDTIKNANFLDSSEVKFIIHDHNGNMNHFLVTPLQEEYFKQSKNVVMINYTKLSQNEGKNRCYRTGVENSRSISECAAKVIEAIVKHNNKGITIEHFHLLGIGLGGQMAGQIPHVIHEDYRDKFVRITALDPANDGFFEDYGTDEYTLGKDDAKLVDVIYSNAGIIGKLPPIGHINWYPNDGTFQPECPIGNYMCDHMRSVIYYMESIDNTSPKIQARWCPNLEANIFRQKLLCKDVTVPFGENIKTDFFNNEVEKGVYIFQTRTEKPYIVFIKRAAPYAPRSSVPFYPIYDKHLEKADIYT